MTGCRVVRTDQPMRATPRRVFRPRRGPSAGRQNGDDGVILVFWALSLTALFGFLALALGIGNLLQSTNNVQNAADAAAMSGAQVIGALNPSPAIETVPIPKYAACLVVGPGDDQLLGCSTLDWLHQYEIFQGTGWLQIVANNPQAGEISELDAFWDGAGNGPWTCSKITKHGYCRQLTTNVPPLPLQDNALSTPSAIQAATQSTTTAAEQATLHAQALVENGYGINPVWTGCPAAPPPGFSFADPGVTCIAYCVPAPGVSCGGSDNATFWVMVLVPAPPSILGSYDVTCTGRAAWANTSGIAPEAPAPSGSCS